MIRLGVLGGRFDPPHIAPLILARLILEHFNLERVLFVPAASPPHKPICASFKDRAAMTRLATQDEEGFEVSGVEQERNLSYTADTLTALQGIYPGTKLYLIIGMDEYECWNTWREPDRILEMAELVVMPRGRRPGRITKKGVHFPDLPLLEISATLVRKRLAQGKPVKHFVPQKVLAYIMERNLYKGGEGNG